PAAKAALLGYDWPGNVRELKNAVERSVYRAEDPTKPIDKILFDPFASPFAPPDSTVPAEVAAGAPDDRRTSGGGDNGTEVPSDFRAAVAEYEVRLLQRALERAQFKQTIAARLLGLTYHQFRSLLRKHGLVKATASEA